MLYDSVKKIITHNINIGDNIYKINLPADFDIYEGLRQWYHCLYNAIIEEDNCKAYCDYIDYLEYLHDY